MTVSASSPDLAKLQRDLRDVAAGMDEAAKEADHNSAELVAEKASSAAHALGGVAARVAPSINAQDGRAVFGGPTYPEAKGAEFGALQFPQFKPWRGDGDGAGYFFTPSIRDTEDEVDQAYYDAVDDLLKENKL